MEDLIQVIKVLDDDQVKIVNGYIDTLEFNPSYVFGTKTGDQHIDEVRTSTGTILDENNSATLLLHDALNKALLDYRENVIKVHENFQYYPVPGAWGTKSWREPIQSLEYVKGQEYKFHHDAHTSKDSSEYHRKITMVLYLNDGFEGGSTTFPHKSFKPPVGYCLVFPSNWCYPHTGEKVKKGKKRVVVTWYYVDTDF